MSKVLIFIEHENGQELSSSALFAIQMGKQVSSYYGGGYSIAFLGASVEKMVKEVAHYGADTVWFYERPELMEYTAENYALVLADFVKKQGIHFVGAISTSLGRDLMPRLAGLLGTVYINDYSDIKGASTFERSTHAGNLCQTYQCQPGIVVATARKTDLTRAEKVENLSVIKEMKVDVSFDSRSCFLSRQFHKAGRPELTEAAIIISGGRGLREKKNFEYLGEVCDQIGAALGASRAACDAGIASSELQIGQTGKVVAPKLYIAVAISGAIQHIAGMKKSKVIVAINKDPEAPIFKIADYGLISTWEKALPELLEEFKKIRKIGE